MNERDYWTVQAMVSGGGSFVKALGVAAMHADEMNLQKIKETWSGYWEIYEKVGEKLQAKEDKVLA